MGEIDDHDADSNVAYLPEQVTLSAFIHFICERTDAAIHHKNADHCQHKNNSPDHFITFGTVQKFARYFLR